MEPFFDKKNFLQLGENDELNVIPVTAQPPEDKRRFPRFKEDASFAYTHIPYAHSINSMTLDVSAGGIRFLAGSFLIPRSLMRVQIKMKFAPRIVEAIVRIVWVREVFGDERYEAGAEFISISPENLNFLKSYPNRT